MTRPGFDVCSRHVDRSSVLTSDEDLNISHILFPPSRITLLVSIPNSSYFVDHYTSLICFNHLPFPPFFISHAYYLLLPNPPDLLETRAETGRLIRDLTTLLLHGNGALLPLYHLFTTPSEQDSLVKFAVTITSYNLNNPAVSPRVDAST